MARGVTEKKLCFNVLKAGELTSRDFRDVLPAACIRGEVNLGQSSLIQLRKPDQLSIFDVGLSF
jgi:hypothetical protein